MQAYVNSKIIKEGLREITFFTPKHNSLPSNILKELKEAIEAADQDDETQVIIIKSGGDRTFCAGASFDELISINDEVTGKSFFMGFASVINACRKCRKIIIGRVQGKAVGGGVGLASAFDCTIASKYSAIKLSELNIGIGPFVIGPAVTRKIGVSAFSQLALDADTFYSAEWAMQKGLYTEVHEDAEKLDAAVMRMADYLLKTNPEAQRKLKLVFWEGTDHWDDLLEERAAESGRLVLSEFTKSVLAKYS